MAAELIKFPGHDIGDIESGLDSLSASVRSGKFGRVHSVAYVIDSDEPNVVVGLLGSVPVPSMTAHYLLALGMRELEKMDGG